MRRCVQGDGLTHVPLLTITLASSSLQLHVTPINPLFLSPCLAYSHLRVSVIAKQTKGA